MKKTLIVLFVVLTLVLTACGGAAQQKPTEAAGAGEPVKISMMMWGSPEELEIWKTLAADFTAKNPNIQVEVGVSDWDSFQEKLKVLHAGGNPPDIFAVDAPLLPDWVGRDAILNLQPYIDATPDFLKDFYPQTLTAYKFPDGMYGLPRDFQTIMMYYNKDMFDAAGVAYPTKDWTMDDFRAIAKKLTKDVNGDGTVEQWGFGADLWDMELFWSTAVWAFGGEIINPEHTKTLIGDANSRKAFEFIDSVVKDGSMPTPDQAAQYGYDLFQSGNVAMWPIGHWALNDYRSVSFKFDVAPMPKGPAGQATSVNSAGFVVSKKSKNPDAAWEFLKFALSTDGQSRLAALGLAIPALKPVAESPAYLEQKTVAIDHKAFLDALAYAHPKPSFKGYEEWATVIGDGLTPVWNGQEELNATLDQILPAADEVLAKN